jgi:hypothetical protein
VPLSMYAISYIGALILSGHNISSKCASYNGWDDGLWSKRDRFRQ